MTLKELENRMTTIESKLDTIIGLLSVVKSGGAETPPPCSYSLFAWVEEWFATYKAPVLKDGGYDLRHNIDKHVKPNIEDKPLNEYNTMDITRALNKVQSERMRQIVRQIYNQSFREAVRLGYIDKNPVDYVKNVSHTYDNGRALERDEEREFMQAAKADTQYYPLFVFYLLTGARPSEPLTITWQDVTADYIRIRGTKTQKSDRKLPLTDDIRALLATLPRTGEKLFPFTYAAVRKHFESVRQKLSFYMTLKDLRHTFGTRCLESGVTMKTVQKWLGHSNYDTTANIYSHITTDFERAEMARLESRHTNPQ